MQLSTENLSIAMVSLFWLIRRKARVPIQGQTLKRNIKKKQFFDEFLSADF